MGRSEHARAGNVIGVSTVGKIKSDMDHMSVDVTLIGDGLPYGLELTLKWPKELPEGRVDFGIASYNGGHSFLCLFADGCYGPQLIYSEHSHSTLIADLAETKLVKINEVAGDSFRAYQVELKHCE